MEKKTFELSITIQIEATDKKAALDLLDKNETLNAIIEAIKENKEQLLNENEEKIILN